MKMKISNDKLTTIILVLVIARFFIYDRIAITNHFVSILFEMSTFIIMFLPYFIEDVKREKLKKICWIVFNITFSISIVYFLLFGICKLIPGTYEEHDVSITDYTIGSRTSRSFVPTHVDVNFDNKNIELKCGKSKLQNFIDEYGKDIQDSVQVQLKVKKVLPCVYSIESFEFVKKTNKKHI